MHAAYAKKHFTEAAEIKEYQTQDEANQDLAAGRIDATQAELDRARRLPEDRPGQGLLRPEGHTSPKISKSSGPGVGAGVRKDDTELKEKINAAIKAIRDNGKYDEITKKYFDFDIYGG